MADRDLLTPRVKGWSTWTLLAGLALHLTVGIWQIHQERFLSRDSVELSFLDITIATFSVYYGGVAFLQLCLAGIHGFVKKYGMKPTLLYIGFVSLLSYVLVVYVLDWGTVKTGSVLHEHLVKRIESSVVEIEERRGPIKQRHPTDTVPYSIEEHTKYAGEDVVFECHRLFSLHSDAYPHRDQVVWERNGEKIQPSDHVNISWTFENVTPLVNEKTKLKHYLISSRLTILFIDNADFGNYSCMVKETVLVKKPKRIPRPMCPLEPPPPCICICICPPPVQPRLELGMDKSRWKDSYFQVKAFSLVRLQYHSRVVYAPPGGIVSYIATYDHTGEMEDVSFDYTIGGQPFDSVCGGMLAECSFLVKIYWIFFHRGGHGDIFEIATGSVRMRTAIRGTGWQCVCKNAYNYHTFWFYRKIYNVTSRRVEILAVKHPHNIILAPRTPDLFFYNFTNKIDPLAKTPCWITPKKQDMIKFCSQEEAMIDWTLWLFLNVEVIVVVLSAFGSFALAWLVSRALTKTVVIPVRNLILEGSLYPCAGCIKTRKPLGCIHEEDHVPKHDVYISHAEDDRKEGGQLADQLEKLGLRVFLPDKHILAGQYKTEAVSAAIASSRLFIVILTKKYIECGMQNLFEFQLILRRILKQTDFKKLLMVKRDQVNVPEILKHCGVLDWTSNDDVDKKIRCLKNWSSGKVNSGEICIC